MSRTTTLARPRPAPVALAVLVALGWPAAGFAQTAPASAASAAAPVLQEGVITSQKRVERLKDTPVAASVMSSEVLEKANATDISDINNLVPSVQLKGSFNGRVPYSMRGISTTANEAAIGLTSGVSIMIDGVPVPSDSTAANDLADVRRVEVLKGPQSTLGGRTASAGVINFVTQQPSRSFSGSAGFTLTDDHEYRGNLFVTGPAGEMLAYSLSLYGSRREYPIRNVLLDEQSQSKSRGARAKLMLSPDKTLDLTLTARVADGTSDGGTFTYQYLTPGAELFPFFPWNGGHGQSQAIALGGVTPGYGNTEYASPVRMQSETRDRDLSLNIEKRFGDYTFTSTTARMSNRQNNLQDVPIVATYFLNDLRGPLPTPADGGPPYYFNEQRIRIEPTSVTQEFKIASPLNQPLSYVAGLFYSDVDVTQDWNRLMFVNPKIDTVRSQTQSLGLYGRGTWTLSEATSLLAGLRANRDRIEYRIDDHAHALASSGSDTSHTVVGDLTLRRKLGKDQMAYATFSRGYKPRAYNTAATLQNNDPLAPVEQEKINHFELGSKFTLLGGKLTLNTALFNTEYKNYQVQIFDNVGGGYVNNLILSSAGRARTRGLELDGMLAAGDDTRVNFSAAYIDAKFLRFGGAPCYPGQTDGCTVNQPNPADPSTWFGTQDLSGKTMPDSSKLKLVLGVEHVLQQQWLPWELRLNAQYSYRTKANLQANQNPKTLQPAYGLMNIGATASSPDGKYSVGLFVNNLFNRFYLVNAEDFFSGLWGSTANAVIGQPARDARRYAGLRFSVNFD